MKCRGGIQLKNLMEYGPPGVVRSIFFDSITGADKANNAYRLGMAHHILYQARFTDTGFALDNNDTGFTP